jgi:hypothetical protein
MTITRPAPASTFHQSLQTLRRWAETSVVVLRRTRRTRRPTRPSLAPPLSARPLTAPPLTLWELDRPELTTALEHSRW